MHKGVVTLVIVTGPRRGCDTPRRGFFWRGAPREKFAESFFRLFYFFSCVYLKICQDIIKD